MQFTRFQVMGCVPDASSRKRARPPRTILDGSSVFDGGIWVECSHPGAPGRTMVVLLPVIEPTPTHSLACRSEAGIRPNGQRLR
jgi:hypothetical protein